MVGIIDCKIGNIGSLHNALSYLGARVEIITRPDDLTDCQAVVLPGVGAFDPAMAAVESSGFAAGVKAYAEEHRPLLGICLGMQILTQGSDEGVLPGLGLFQGRAVNLRKLGCMGKVPHVGFNSVQSTTGDSGFIAGTSESDFYFVHSFGLPCSNLTGSSSIVEYQGAFFIAALHHENLFATQFHPEKSGDAGLILLEYFLSCSRSA